MESQQTSHPMYWQSLEDLANSPELNEARHHEFQKGVTDDFDPREMTGISRRRFLAAMGASAAFALTACKNYMDKGEVIPYNNQPEEVVIGRPNYYASTVTVHGHACSALIKTREGRPLKIAGNPEHPVDQGRMGSHFQAQIMSLYDPERLSKPLKGGAETTAQAADEAVIAALKGLAASGKKAAVLTHRVMSPTAKKALQDLQKTYPGTEIYSYGMSGSEQRQSAWEKSYGSSQMPDILWEQADVVLALESDFLGVEGQEHIERRFASRRDVMNGNAFNRLYVVEGNLSLTGMNADYRMRLRPDAQYAFVMALAKGLEAQGVKLSAALAAKAASFELAKVAQTYGLAESTLKHLISDLQKNQGKAIVYAGDRLPEAVHIAVNALNAALGAEKLYSKQYAPVEQHKVSSSQELKALVADMAAGKIEAVIHFKTNPVYDLSALGYADALAKVPLSVSIVTNLDETGQKSTYVLPAHHELESWGDFQVYSGLYSLQQPVIAPLHATRQAEGILLAWKAGAFEAYNEKLYLNYLKQNWQDTIYRQSGALTDFNNYWKSALHSGFVQIKGKDAGFGSFKDAALSGVSEIKAGGDFVLSLHPAYATLDGEFANHGWLQEIPHPVSKVVWDNYAAMSLATAKALGVKTESMVQIEVNGKTVTLPVLEQPGMADQVIAVEFGYGRTVVGEIGQNVGVDVNPLLALATDSPFIVKAAVSKASGKHHLVTTQIHHAFDVPREQDLHFKRAIVHEANYLEFAKDPESAKMHGHPVINITDVHQYPDIKWAMAIDMNKCTGCNACIMACNVENNVPVVGPDQVDRGREMHWMRLDRYYSGTPEEPKVSQQVMLCQHCDNAPCEVVCPVNATNHSADGLNQMAYNRCVGTRYCSNNCPYKVRRFNFFDYRDRFAKAYYHKELPQLVHNPEVTVRSRGVMEKCSFCVQRIMWARQEAIREKRELKGSDVVVACQEVCPSEAIYFGDSNDPNSAVSKYRKHVTAYHVLEEFNARPNVTYAARLRNTYEKV